MKVNKKEFLDFLKKVSYDGRILECILEFNEDAVSCKALAKDTQIFVDTSLNKAAFSEYKAIGMIGVKDSLFMKNIIERFSKDIKLSIKDNIFSAKEDTREIITTIADPDFISKAPELNIEFKEPIIISVKELDDIISDAKLFSDDASLQIEVDKGFIKFSISDNQDKLIRIIKNESIINEKRKTSFRVNNFRNMVRCLTGEKVKLYIDNDTPIKLFEEVGLIKTNFYIAPCVEGQTTEKNKDE